MERIDKLKKKMMDLAAEAPMLPTGGTSKCGPWAVAAVHAVEEVCDSRGPYVKMAQVAMADCVSQHRFSNGVRTMAELLGRVLDDIESGLIGSLASAVRAETYDDLLDHAQAYLDEGRKNPAGVLAGVVFEDTIRRMSRDRGHTDPEEALDTLLSWLKSHHGLNAITAKRGVAAADLRTKATHANWDRFEDGDVASVITFTRELLVKYFT